MCFLTSFEQFSITLQKSKEIQTQIRFMSFLFGEYDIKTGDIMSIVISNFSIMRENSSLKPEKFFQ